MSGQDNINSAFLIVGLGQIGSSIAAAIKKKSGQIRVIGVDRCWKNYYSGLVDDFFCHLKPDAAKDSTVILATPPEVALKQLPLFFSGFASGQLVITVCSLMQPFWNFRQKLCQSEQKRLIVGHPFCGTTNRGSKAVCGQMFSGKIFFLAGKRESSAIGNKRFNHFLKLLEMKAVRVDPADHDLKLVYSSHWLALVNYLLFEFVNKRLDSERIFLGSGFFKATSLVLSSPQMVRELFLLNRENQLKCFQEFVLFLEESLKHLQSNGFDFHLINRQAQKWRKEYEKYLCQL